MKSKNGTTSTNKMLLTPKDVCEIISKCGEAKVSKLKFGNLYVSFLDKETANSTQSHAVETSVKDNLNVEKEVLEELELIHKEDEMANLHIENPSAYEDGLANGDFIDLGKEEADADA